MGPFLLPRSLVFLSPSLDAFLTSVDHLLSPKRKLTSNRIKQRQISPYTQSAFPSFKTFEIIQLSMKLSRLAGAHLTNREPVKIAY